MQRRLTLQTKKLPKGTLRRSPSLVPNLFSPLEKLEWKAKNFGKYYTCTKVLGMGAQGTAISLKNNVLPNREVVAKLYNDTPKNRELVENEIAILKRLNANGCKPFLLCFQENFVSNKDTLKGVCYLSGMTSTYLVVVYDYFLGDGTTSLSSFISLPNPDNQSYITYETQDGGGDNFDGSKFVFSVIFTLLKAVDYMHKSGVAHLDLKPANVIVNLAKEKVQLIDFGLSCMGELCQAGGTIPYMAKEVLRAIGNRELTLEDAMLGDSWSIGVMIYQLINQTSPFRQVNVTEYVVGTMTQKDLLPSRYEEPPLEVAAVMNHIVDGFLRVEPQERLSVSTALELLRK